jgi:surface antigen
MVRFLRSGIAAAALFCAAAFGLSNQAEARSHFFFSANIGVPFYPWYQPAYYPAPYYDAYYYGPRPYYRPYIGAVPAYSLGLFPTYVGTALTPDDRAIYYTAYRRALAAPVGQAMEWNSGPVNGSVTTTRDGWAGQRYCREFQQDITIGGSSEKAFGTACQQTDGSWQIVRQ